MHMVAPLFEAGVVWAPIDKKFADEVIEEVVSFPNGDHDDFCDSMTLALMRFRQGGLYLCKEKTMNTTSTVLNGSITNGIATDCRYRNKT